jgi:DNA-binding transcriptional regulator YiaG
MPNVGAVIREEITRLSRRESRTQVSTTKKATLQHRHEIAALKRQYANLARQVALLNRKVLSAPATASNGPGTNGKKVRFVAKGLRSQRERLGLSQPNLSKLLGVSPQTVYNWEHGESRPRAEQLAKIAALRTLGKREAAERLKQVNRGNGGVRRRA